jgi:hypothetical protein
MKVENFLMLCEHGEKYRRYSTQTSVLREKKRVVIEKSQSLML